MFFLLLPTISPKLVLSWVGNHLEKQYLDPFQDLSEWCLVGCMEGRTTISPCPFKLHIAAGLHFPWQGECRHSSTITNCNETPNYTFYTPIHSAPPQQTPQYIKLFWWVHAVLMHVGVAFADDRLLWLQCLQAAHSSWVWLSSVQDGWCRACLCIMMMISWKEMRM